MSHQNFKLHDAIADLESAIKMYHGAVVMLSECDSINENIYYTFCGIGDVIQQKFNRLEENVKAIACLNIS
jgi:hypothetical protein